MNIDLKSISKKIIQFRNDRDWEQYHNPKNLAQTLGIETAELQEIFLWKSTEELENIRQDEIDRVKEELADIFIYMTYIYQAFKIDIFNEVLKNIEKNSVKYPGEKFKGSNKKYNQL